MKRAMIEELTRMASAAKPGRRMARRIFEAEAYRRIITGKAPETLSAFAAQLYTWFKTTYPTAPALPSSFIEAAIRDTWHRRHEVIGSEL